MMQSHRLAELYADQLSNTIWLELGATTSGVGSTEYLRELASRYNATLLSVDMIPSDKEYVINSDCEEFCKNYDFENKLGLVYLDNFDWMWEPQQYREFGTNSWMENQIKSYAQRGLAMNNVNSTTSHYKQICALDNAWAEKSVVIMDDTWFEHTIDQFSGKGSAAIYHLLSYGWQVLNGNFGCSYVVIGKNLQPKGNPIFDISVLNQMNPGVGHWRNLD